MSRLADAIASGGYANNNFAPMLDMAFGGNGGWSPNVTEFISNQAYVSRPIIPILLEVPKLFTVLPESYKYIAALKTMFELRAKTWDGFNSSIKVDFDEHPVGGAGEKHQEVVNATREQTIPKWSGVELYGRPIQNLMEIWIRYGMMDPDTKFALAGTLASVNIEDLLADWNTASCLFIEPDPLHKKVNKAWLCVNMMPDGTGPIEGKRDLTSGQEILNLDFTFTAITQQGLGVRVLAQQILDSIRSNYADPSMYPAAVQGVSPDVEAITRGYKQWIENVGNSAVSSIA